MKDWQIILGMGAVLYLLGSGGPFRRFWKRRGSLPHYRVAVRWLIVLVLAVMDVLVPPSFSLGFAQTLALFGDRTKDEIPFPKTTAWMGGALGVGLLLGMLEIGIRHRHPTIGTVLMTITLASGAAFALLTVVSDITTMSRSLRGVKRQESPADCQ